MTKADIVARVATDARVSKAAAERALDSFVAALNRGLRLEGRAAYPGLGVLVAQERKARQGRNPQTGEPLAIPAKMTVRLRPAASLIPKF